jgi:hypothetical protein
VIAAQGLTARLKQTKCWRLLIGERRLSRMRSSAGATVFLLTVFGAGCAQLAVAPSAPVSGAQAAAANQCAALYASIGQAVMRSGVRDAQSVIVPGFPYLRADRFLAGFRSDALSEAQLDALLDRLQQTALGAWGIEFSNLPAAEQARIVPSLHAITGSDDLSTALRHCGTLLRTQTLNSVAAKRAVQARARFADDYSPWRRVLGFYPLTAIPFRAGIERFSRATRAVFEQPVERLPVRGQLLAWEPELDRPMLNSAAVTDILRLSADNPLHVPTPDPQATEQLFAAFAPVFQIDTASSEDRIGAAAWRADGSPHIDVQDPAVYRHISHVRFAEQILLQLNYVIWFPSRPADSAFDTLAGRLDGITWRVTLSPDGHPLLYDTIHNCGCYHWFLPTRRLRAKPPPQSLEETAFVPQSAPELKEGERIALRIAPRTHYIERVSAVGSVARGKSTYRFADYDELRSLPRPGGGRRSLFEPNGLVAGSERLERFFFWPMGIASPGAMRQWGRHATAFVGRRHFDDPDLLESAFQ